MYERRNALPRAYAVPAASAWAPCELHNRMREISRGDRPASELRDRVLLTDAGPAQQGTPGTFTPATVEATRATRCASP